SKFGGFYAYQLSDHLGNVRAVVMKDGINALSLTNKTDYYPGGMAMPNRNIVSNYPYGYQGQELDKETGKVAFKLRLYDARINRWVTPDPYAQYDSPYMAMGNDWVNGIDPDGGCYIKNEDGSYSPCPDAEVGTTRTGAFGYSWTYTKDNGWQVTNGASGTIETSYDPILADGTADYYIKRYVSHLKRYNSKPPDYYLGYGHKYINRFKNVTRPKLSNAGKKWLDRTAIGLQFLMNKGLRESNGAIALNNDKFRSFAFDTHVPAYVGSGLLDLGVKDKMTIGTTPDFGDLATFDGIKQANDIWLLQQLNWIGLFNLDTGKSGSNSNCGCPN
ncbi:MAG: RHS repeat domain-containing protein, partial [Xanthomarina gelatinilytica]|uniref:RHS repeat domain-containing protein n=1 Tax=Xanthomarina gelatinilytica TaxID=1137281 RepID=UPI003A84A8AC